MQNHKKLVKIIIGIAVALILVLGYNHYGQKNGNYILDNGTAKLSSVTVNPSEQMTPEEVKEDFDYFMNIIKKDYPYLEINQRLNGVNFLENEGRYWLMFKNVKTKTEFAEKLSNMITHLNNGHTDLMKINDNSKMRDMYYTVYSDISKTDETMGIIYKPWVETLEREESKVLYGPLPSLTDSKGQTGNTGTKAQGEVYPNNVKPTILENGKLIYIKIKSFNYFNEQADKPLIIDFIKSHINAKVLVIDIRENGGGSTEYFKNLLVEPLISEPLTITRYNFMRRGFNNKPYMDAISKANPGIIKPISELDPQQFPKAKPEVFTKFDSYTCDKMIYSPKNSLGYKGKIYVLVSGRVYSASEAFSSFCKDTGFATLIGQQTGGDGYGIDPALFCLPNSGILGRYPFQYGTMKNGEASEEVRTMPDYIIEDISVKENLLLDRCIQKVIELENL